MRPGGRSGLLEAACASIRCGLTPCSVIASAAKQSSLSPRTHSGWLRCARNDDARARTMHHAPVLPDGASGIRKMRSPLIRLTSATVHGVVFEISTGQVTKIAPCQASSATSMVQEDGWWAHKGSNLGPLPCEGTVRTSNTSYFRAFLMSSSLSAHILHIINFGEVVGNGAFPYTMCAPWHSLA